MNIAGSPEQQLVEFIDRFTPEVAAVVKSARKVIRKRFPTANELVYDGYNALAIGYGSTQSAGQSSISLAVYPRGVLLYFMRGATLSDPAGLLTGSGSQGRHIPLNSVQQLDDPRVVCLIETAFANAPIPLPEKGNGQTVIKSIVAKQRPRRPTPKTAEPKTGKPHLAARTSSTGKQAAKTKSAAKTSAKKPAKTAAKLPAKRLAAQRVAAPAKKAASTVPRKKGPK